MGVRRAPIGRSKSGWFSNQGMIDRFEQVFPGEGFGAVGQRFSSRVGVQDAVAMVDQSRCDVFAH